MRLCLFLSQHELSRRHIIVYPMCHDLWVWPKRKLIFPFALCLSSFRIQFHGIMCNRCTPSTVNGERQLWRCQAVIVPICEFKSIIVQLSIEIKRRQITSTVITLLIQQSISFDIRCAFDCFGYHSQMVNIIVFNVQTHHRWMWSVYISTVQFWPDSAKAWRILANRAMHDAIVSFTPVRCDRMWF